MKRSLLLVCAALLCAAPPAHAQDVNQLHTAIREVAAIKGIDSVKTHDGAHAFTQAVADKLVCLDANWGRKSTNGGPISADTLAYRLGPLTADGRNTPMRVYDYCQSCGDADARVNLGSVLDHGVITNQRYRPVSSAHCTTPDPKPDPEPEPDPGTGTELGALLLRIVALLEQLKTSQDEQTSALHAAIVELRKQVEKGVKIRF